MNDLKQQLYQRYANKKILVVGLGIQGSGLGVTKFFANLGASVTVTDTKTAEQLSQSIEKLKDYNIKYVLGHHDTSDFVTADLIIKGMDGAIASRHVTYDFARLMKQEGVDGVQEVKCSEFGQQIIKYM